MSKLEELINDYKQSLDYNNLRTETKAQYAYHLSILQDEFGKARLKSITPLKVNKAYDKWCKRGVSFANHIVAVARVLFNHGVRMEIAEVNPFDKVRRRTTKPRRTVWKKEQVIDFLTVAYSNPDTRNIGLIAQMAYEWGQRLGDMRMLTWDSIDFDEQKVEIQQSKRRAEVSLPISDELFDMLKEQEEYYGFQPFVAPRPQPMRGRYEPYTIYKLPLHAKKIMRAANIPEDYRLSDMRRTATTEMLQAGVGMGQIMSVTGHANPQSVKPYMKATYDSANYALTQRKNHGK